MNVAVDHNLEKTYWFHKGRHNRLAKRLRTLIPKMGECPDNKPALEAFREASNLYYDIYNNGGCNYQTEINDTFRIDVEEYMAGDKCDPATVAKIEAKMDELIVAAGKENRK